MIRFYLSSGRLATITFDGWRFIGAVCYLLVGVWIGNSCS